MIASVVLALFALANPPARVVEGELVEADFIHRGGQFRSIETGELVDFVLVPSAVVLYLDAEADLRDVPIGTVCRFAFEPGPSNRVVAVQDDFSRKARQGASDRLEPKDATESQQRRHDAFLKERGLAARIERVEGGKLTVALFGDPSSLKRFFQAERIDPTRWAAERQSVYAAVATEELRTFNPQVDKKRATVLGLAPGSTEAEGRWVIEPELLLEGFRKGRIIRMFAPSWPIVDMPFGEGVYTEDPGVKPWIEEPIQYPYRTDFANDDLPWYQLKPGELPPLKSAHDLIGELESFDPRKRAGRFRVEGTGERVDFAMLPFGVVRQSGTEADADDLAVGTRYRFSLYQDERGAFTRVGSIADDADLFAADDLTYRLDSIDLAGGQLLLAKHHAPVKDERDKLVQPPDLARGRFAVGSKTRVWKGNRMVGLDALAVGDELRIDLTGRTSTARGTCTDLWIGRESFDFARDRLKAKHEANLRANGLPAWVEGVGGKGLLIAFFAADRKDFLAEPGKGVEGDGVRLVLTDDALEPLEGPAIPVRFRDLQWDGPHASRCNSSGVRWNVEAEKVDERFRPGRALRVFPKGWARPERLP